MLYSIARDRCVPVDQSGLILNQNCLRHFNSVQLHTNTLRTILVIPCRRNYLYLYSAHPKDIKHVSHYLFLRIAHLDGTELKFSAKQDLVITELLFTCTTLYAFGSIVFIILFKEQFREQFHLK